MNTDAPTVETIDDSAIYAAIPEPMRPVMSSIIEASRATLAAGGGLTPSILVGNCFTTAIRRIKIDPSSPHGKAMAVEAAKEAAEEIEADFAITMVEAWHLSKEDKARKSEIVAAYGSLAAYPGRIEVVYFVLETHDGVVATTATIDRTAATTRTMRPPKPFERSSVVGGGLVSVLSQARTKSARMRMH